MEERRKRIEELVKSISWKDFLPLPFGNKRRPWLLVPNGSLLGSFDWVPEQLRVGPWSIVTIPYICIHLYLMALFTIWIMDPANTAQTPTIMTAETTTIGTTWPFLQDDYQAYTLSWYYNFTGFLWMSFVALQVYRVAGVFPMVTFTMQSWTVLQLRHLLSALAPLAPHGSIYYTFLLSCAESLRFLALSVALITFVFWNCFIGPAIYLFLKDGAQRAGFIQYFTSWRLVQLHVFNIVYAVLNGVYASPKRLLTAWDFYVAAVFATVYLLFYLLVLDRMGVHLYPIYSPRTPWVALTLTMNMAFYGATFWFWRRMLRPQ
jgi:hypothetical protein